ncbi:MAG: TIGR04076 family protein [Clostridium sp.]|uniref:TIGR04076 family protein n=1 Tax=Clostridium sp. DSM 8431 TaxID=1761781 RepID=UPI0008E8D663|nr:TIGR04076 family protein [Clostridium sp. DSM 8431]MCR4944174.1 TIGR04076 family protein [Clostridium sp.]SFU32465.1 TIGR04076 family protein [Clostridium sp. DSM 8431]
MVIDPGYNNKVIATVVSVKGHCAAGHKVGDKFEVSVINAGNMCGLCYNRIFPALCTYQFDGNFPWWVGDNAIVQCPDQKNLVSIKLEKEKIEK